MGARKLKVTFWDILSLAPLLGDAIIAAGIEVAQAKAPDGASGSDVTPDEAAEVADVVYAKLRPFAVAVADLALSKKV